MLLCLWSVCSCSWCRAFDFILVSPIFPAQSPSRLHLLPALVQPACHLPASVQLVHHLSVQCEFPIFSLIEAFTGPLSFMATDSAPSLSFSSSASVKSGSADSDYQSPLDYVLRTFLHLIPLTVSVLLPCPRPVWTCAAAPGLLYLGVIFHGHSVGPAPITHFCRLQGPCSQSQVGVRLPGLEVCDPPPACLSGMVLILSVVLVVVRTCGCIRLPIKRISTVRRSSPRWSLSVPLPRYGLHLIFLRLC